MNELLTSSSSRCDRRLMRPGVPRLIPAFTQKRKGASRGVVKALWDIKSRFLGRVHGARLTGASCKRYASACQRCAKADPRGERGYSGARLRLGFHTLHSVNRRYTPKYICVLVLWKGPKHRRYQRNLWGVRKRRL